MVRVLAKWLMKVRYRKTLESLSDMEIGSFKLKVATPLVFLFFVYGVVTLMTQHSSGTAPSISELTGFNLYFAWTALFFIFYLFVESVIALPILVVLDLEMMSRLRNNSANRVSHGSANSDVSSSVLRAELDSLRSMNEDLQDEVSALDDENSFLKAEVARLRKVANG